MSERPRLGSLHIFWSVKNFLQLGGSFFCLVNEFCGKEVYDPPRKREKRFNSLLH